MEGNAGQLERLLFFVQPSVSREMRRRCVSLAPLGRKRPAAVCLVSCHATTLHGLPALLLYGRFCGTNMNIVSHVAHSTPLTATVKSSQRPLPFPLRPTCCPAFETAACEPVFLTLAADNLQSAALVHKCQQNRKLLLVALRRIVPPAACADLGPRVPFLLACSSQQPLTCSAWFADQQQVSN